jgi:hypothetical protein
MRVPYSFNPPPASGPEETAIVDAVLQRRGTLMQDEGEKEMTQL